MQPQDIRLRTSQALAGFFLSLAAEGRSSRTLRDYHYCSRMLTTWLKAQGQDDPPVAGLDTETLRRFFADLRRRQPRLSAKTVRNTHTALRSFWSWLGRELGLPHVLKGAITAPRANPPAFTLPTREQIESVLQACDWTRPATSQRRKSYRTRRPTARRDRAIIMTLVDTGVRAQELCDLAMCDLDMASGAIVVRHGKGDKSRIVYAGKAVRRAIWRYLATERPDARPGEPLFAERCGRPLTQTALSHLVMQLGRRAGVKVWPHLLRHVFATQYLRGGGSTLALKRLMGHVSETMLERYVELAECDLQRAHETASPADRWRL